MRLSSTLLAGLLLVASPAAAQAPSAPGGEAIRMRPSGERQIGKRERPTHRPRADTQAERSGQPRQQIPSALRASLERKIEARIRYDIAEAKKLRREALGLLGKLVVELPETSPEMPDALMRLGELEWEEARDAFLLAFHRWEAQPPERRGAPPDPNYGRPRARFLRVLTRYKSYADYDLALYVDGFLANEEGKFSEARGRFDKILEWFPKSRFVPDAHMVRAEYEFTKDAPDYQIAFREYEKVLSYKTSDLYDLALFKSAWTLWRLGQSEQAAKRFLTVFQATEQRGRRPGARRAEIDELQAEALRNLVAVFVEDEKNRAEDMFQFLVKAGGDRFAAKIVRALAEAFYDQAHYERGVEAYRLLLKLEPTSPHAYQHALQIARGRSTMEAWKKLEQDYRWILAEFTLPVVEPGRPARPASGWVQVQKPLVLTRTKQAIETQLREDAVGLHAKAQADKSKVEFEAAAALYGVYLSRFANELDAYEVYFNLGEVHFYHLNNAHAAADSYLAAVRLDPKNKLSRDALYNALAALEVARAAELDQAKREKQKPQESPLDRKLTEAMELYVKSYPDDAHVPELLFRQGKLYYDYAIFDPAVRQFGLLLEKYPNSKFSAMAGELILDSFNKSEDFQNIETWARRLKTAPAFQSPEQQKRFGALIVQAMFKQGEQLGQKGQHAKAAAAYLRAAREFPAEPRAAQAAVNAEIEARRAADLKTLKQAVELLVQNHKQRPEAAHGLWIAATTHQEVGLFGEAARYHDLIVDGFPRYEHHKDAAYNAVLLRTTVGEHDAAIASGNKYKRHYPRDEGADEVTFLMGKAHEKAKKYAAAADLYERYAHAAKSYDSQVESLVRLARVRLELGDARSASNALERARKVGTQRKGRFGDRGRYFAAQASYMQGERVLAAYEAVKIEGDVKQLKARLKKKTELLKKAADAFLETAELGVAEWTTAALYQIGFTYESFAKALLGSPPPPNLSAEERELYAQSIDEFVIPIEERSLEAYETGWKKAIELGIFNTWTAKMREALGRLNAELYPPLHEVGFELRSKASAPLPPLIDGLRRTRDGRSQPYLIAAPALVVPPGKAGAKEQKR